LFSSFDSDQAELCAWSSRTEQPGFGDADEDTFSKNINLQYYFNKEQLLTISYYMLVSITSRLI